MLNRLGAMRGNPLGGYIVPPGQIGLKRYMQNGVLNVNKSALQLST